MMDDNNKRFFFKVEAQTANITLKVLTIDESGIPDKKGNLIEQFTD